MAKATRTKSNQAANHGGALMALENEHWMSLRKAADAVLNQVLTQAYRKLGIAHHVTEHGVQMDAYTREHILLHSDGAKSVRSNLERRGIDPQTATAKQKQGANFAERRHKLMFALSAMRDMWRARSVSVGFPVFEPGDTRLETGFVLSPAMTPSEAIEAGMTCAAEGGIRLFNELRLLEVSIKASSYATPHAEIKGEIERQMQENELVMHRGVLARPSPNIDLDAAHTARPDVNMAPLASYAAAVERIQEAEAKCGHPGLLTQVERDGVANAIAGESRCTSIATASYLSQPAVVAAIQASANAAGVEVVRLAPLLEPSADAQSLEAALARRVFAVAPGSVVLIENAQGVSQSAHKEVELKTQACNARLVSVYGPGHAPTSIPLTQMSERALQFAAGPIEQLAFDADQDQRAGTQNLVGYQDSNTADQALIAAAAKAISRQEPAVVLASTRASADRLNTGIAAELAVATGQTPKTVRAMKANPVSDPKNASSYAVGDTILLKRTTGSLRRKEVATVESINSDAGFLKLSVKQGDRVKSISLSLSSQAHHIVRVRLQDIPVQPGTMLRTDAAMRTLGLAEGQVVTVQTVSDESGLIRLRGLNGSDHEVSVAGAPLQMSLAMARTPDELTMQDRIHARIANPQVLVHLDAGSTQQEIGAVLSAAHSLSPQVNVHYAESLLATTQQPVHSQIRDRHQKAATKESGLRRLVVQESDEPGMSRLRGLLGQSESASVIQALNLTLVSQDGQRTLHKLRSPNDANKLAKELDKRVDARKPKTPDRAAQAEMRRR